MALRQGLRSSVQIVPHPTALIRRARRARRGHRRGTSTEGRGTGLEVGGSRGLAAIESLAGGLEPKPIEKN